MLEMKAKYQLPFALEVRDNFEIFPTLDDCDIHTLCMDEDQSWALPSVKEGITLAFEMR